MNAAESDIATADGRHVPVVDYLVLDPGGPYLRAHECTSCAARFFDRRNACAACGGRTFTDVAVAGHGTLRSFSIVHRAAPGIDVPFVSAIVDCDGTSVRANVVNCEPDPGAIRLGMPLRLVTFAVATDDEDTTAIAFGYEPVDEQADPEGGSR